MPPKRYEDGPDRKPGHEDSAAFEWRFRAMEQRLDDVSDTLRVLAPVVRQVGNIEADVEHAQAAIAEIKAFNRDLEKGMTDVIRSSRTETVRLIGIVVGSFTAVAVAIIGAFAKGLIG